MTSSATSRKARSGGAIQPDTGGALSPGDVVDGYVIEKEIGRGGMGVVYLAREQATERLCALKQIRGEMAQRPDALERFHTEAKILAALEHPCIVTMYAAGTHQRRPYIVMQWIQGRTLREVMHRRRAPFPLTQALSIAVQLGTALRAAHRLGILHRDVKPENVIIPREGPVKLLDWGIGKFRDGAATTDRLAALVTALYAAPEQLARTSVDARADVYALALLLLEMATGRHGFADAGETIPSDPMVAALHSGAQPNRLIDHVAGCPESLSAIVARALSKDREQRPDMATFVAALRGEQRALFAAQSATNKEEEEEQEDESDVEGAKEDESDNAAPPTSRSTALIPASFVPGRDAVATFIQPPRHFRPVDRTEQMVPSASAQLAAQGKTLEQARAEARARPASLPPPPTPVSGRQPISGIRPAAPLARTETLARAPEIPRPSIEVRIPRSRIPRSSLELAPPVKKPLTQPDGQRGARATSAWALLAAQGKTLEQAQAEALRETRARRLRAFAAVGAALALALAAMALALRETRSWSQPRITAPAAAASATPQATPAPPSRTASPSRRPSDAR